MVRRSGAWSSARAPDRRSSIYIYLLKLDLSILRMPPMSIRVGVNGFGRIGRLAVRAAWDRPGFEFVQVNEIQGDAATAAHLLSFDSIHGRWSRSAEGDVSALA